MSPEGKPAHHLGRPFHQHFSDLDEGGFVALPAPGFCAAGIGEAVELSLIWRWMGLWGLQSTPVQNAFRRGGVIKVSPRERARARMWRTSTGSFSPAWKAGCRAAARVRTSLLASPAASVEGSPE
jgi:hypothetical protein